MKFFLDTADIAEIESVLDTGMVDGVTTNPSLIAKSGRKIKEVIKEISNLVPGPVSAEVIATEYKEMIKEGHQLSDINSNIVVKLPITWDGIKACKYFSENNIPTNMTLCFSTNQALLVAKAGAMLVSPFIGRLDDNGQIGINLIEDIIKLYDNYMLDTMVLGASIRTTEHVLRCAMLGCGAVTMPVKILKQLISHPLTDIGLENFLQDYKKSISQSTIP